MNSASHATPRSRKFSRLKNIRSEVQSGISGNAVGPATARSTCATKRADEGAGEEGTMSTLKVLDRQREDVAVRDDTDERIRRHRYAQTVLRFVDQSTQYHSIGLFVEAMLGELAMDVDADVATRAAVGTWALNLLSSQSPNGALQAIAEVIMPVVYCRYTPAALSRPSAAIRAQVRDPTVIQSNPYLTHSMYVEQVNADRRSVETLTTGLRHAIAANDLRRDHVMRQMAARRAATVKIAFRAWRSQARRSRILATTNENRSKRQEAAMRQMRLQAVFYHWKTVLELSRNAFLTERLHDAAGQLENAKNQFQLQCYRADRLIQASKETKAELARTQGINEELQRRIEALKEELIQREQEYNAKLNENVAAALQLVQSYSKVVTVLVEARMKPLHFQTEEEDTEMAIGDAAAVPHRDSTLSDSDVRRRSSETLTATAGSPSDPANGGVFPRSEEASDEKVALETLRRWCNSVLREVQGAHFRPIGNFAGDFASGELYLVLLHYVFPETTSLVPNQESNVDYRLRRIASMSVKSGLVHVLSPDDFADKREDRIIQSLCELYTRYLDKQWKTNSAAVVVSFQGELQKREGPEGGAEAPVVVDDVTFRALVQQYSERLAVLKEDLLKQCSHEDELASSKEKVKAEEARLVEEERKGIPLLFVSDSSTRPFWALKPQAIEDLRTAEKIGNDSRLWLQLVAGPLPRMLRECAPITTRLFCFYAGESARTMSEFAFWRFVDVQDMSSLGPQKELVARVFDRVSSPQLEIAIKAASHSSADMDTHTLLSMARQELDIRNISPSQFVEVLLRLSVELYGRSLGLIEGVGRFLRSIPLPRKSAQLPIQAALYQPDAQYVVYFFSNDLARVFFFYLKRQQSSKNARERVMAVQDGGRFAGLLSAASLTQMLDDCVFLSDGATATRLGSAAREAEPETGSPRTPATANTATPSAHKSRAFISSSQVLACVNGLSSVHASLKPGELTFTVFVESLFAISNYWCPNPLVPPSRKLAAFLADYIGQLNNRHSNSTLILGAPPFITLEGGSKVDFTLKANDLM